MIPQRIIEYWQCQFGSGRCVLDDGTLSLTIDAALDSVRQAMILTRSDDTTAVAITPALATRAGLFDTVPMSPSDLRRRLTTGGVALNDPDFLFYRCIDWQSADSGPARQLTEADRNAFDRFRRSASPKDLDDAWVEFDHPVLFGSFVRGRLVCVASMVPWRDGLIADLGVLTLPDARGHGHARAVVSAITDHAIAMGFEPQYRCQTDNRASIALAKSAGFVSFGRWEVLDTPDA